MIDSPTSIRDNENRTTHDSDEGKRLSSRDRLSKLGEVFSVEEFQKVQGLSAKSASVYLARWSSKSHRLISAFGPRCGVWLNRSILTPEQKSRMSLQTLIKAIAYRYPDMIVIDNNSFEKNSEERELTIIVPQGVSKAIFHKVNIHRVPARKFRTLNSLAQSKEGYSVKFLDPDNFKE